jgi:hypothetical protein
MKIFMKAVDGNLPGDKMPIQVRGWALKERVDSPEGSGYMD